MLVLMMDRSQLNQGMGVHGILWSDDAGDRDSDNDVGGDGEDVCDGDDDYDGDDDDYG